MLTKMSTTVTHKKLADSREFGGSETRWQQGYRWLVMYLDRKFYHLIGPEAIAMWVPSFPMFRNKIYAYLKKKKLRTRAGIQRVVQWNHEGAPTREEFNVCSFTDCCIYKCCRLGSGPAHPNEDAPRRPFAYVMQRALWDGHHRTHAIKMLTQSGPNGMTLGTYGPTSAYEQDPTLYQWSDWDDFVCDLCLQHFGKIFASYPDSIFHGYWYDCIRTRHEPLVTLGLFLTGAEENENDNFNSARESIELGYGRSEQLFPLLTVKSARKLGVDADLVYAQTRVMHFLTNVITCLREGNTCTGERMFACPPPSLSFGPHSPLMHKRNLVGSGNRTPDLFHPKEESYP